MPILRRIAGGVRALFRKAQAEREMDEELRGYLDAAAKDKMQNAMTPEEARRAARVEIGSLEAVKDEIRSAGWESVLETVWQDLRYGAHQLRRNSGFTIAAVLTLALGIGATTAIFSVVETVLLHSPPYQAPDRLVALNERSPQGEESELSAGDFADLHDQSRAFQGMAAYTLWEFHTLTGVREPDEVWSSAVSPNLFDVLGTHATLGRTFVASDTQSLVLSFRYWRSHFLSDPSLIGKVLTLDGKPYAVVGVMPPEFEFPASDAQMWIPLIFSDANRANHKERSLSVIARLKAGASLRQAQAEMETIGRQWETQNPETNRGWSVVLKQFKGPQPGRDLKVAIFAALGAVIFVQLIVCANVVNTLLARGAARQGEMAIRAALGASRWRLVRQLLVETLMLAGAGSLAGLLLASVGLHLIVSLVPRYTMTQIHDVAQITINLPVLGFTAALSLLTGIAVGLLPALRVSRFNLEEGLKERGRTSGTSARTSVVQRGLVVSEVALALILLIGAGLMVQSFGRLTASPVGFNPDHILTVRVPLAKYKYSEGPQSANFYREVLQRIRAIPGVKSAGMSNNLPFTGFSTRVDFPASPDSPAGRSGTIYVATRSVSPGYFQALGIPLRAGRDFNETDNERNVPCVRIVNEAMARLYWPGQVPVALQVPRACPKDAAALIVGVVGDSKQDSVNSPPEPELFIPYGQLAFASYLATFVIRTASDPADVANAVRRAVWEVDRDQPVIQIRTMENVILESLWQQHFSESTLSTFALIALFLSAIGIYSVLSYSVSRRTHEIGIRMALGATRSDVLKLIIGQGIVLTSMGVACGAMASLGLTRILASLLYGVKSTDPPTFVTAIFILTGVALAACYIPARRAMKVDPMVALRYE